MIQYLTEELIKKINELELEVAKEGNEYLVTNPNDIPFTVSFVKNLEGDLIRKALAYCVSLIIHHPFQNGNHRASLIAAQYFLDMNNVLFIGVDQDRVDIQKRRIEYEDKNDLERIFFSIASIEDLNERGVKIIEMMDSKYGEMIKEWLEEKHSTKN